MKKKDAQALFPLRFAAAGLKKKQQHLKTKRSVLQSVDRIEKAERSISKVSRVEICWNLNASTQKERVTKIDKTMRNRGE